MNRTLKYVNKEKVNLANNIYHKFAANHALSVYNVNAIYTYIPKNACSTLRFSIALKNGFLKNKGDVEWIHENNTTFIASQRELVTCEYSFVILRCPYRRIASAFFDKISEGNLLAKPLFKRNLFTKIMDKLCRLNKYSNRYRNKFWSKKIKKLTFEDFIKRIVAIQPHKLDNHLRPQIDFLVYDEYDDYFCLERIGLLQNTLKEKINLEIHDTRKLIKHDASHLEKININANKLTAGEISNLKNRGKIPKYESVYSDATKKLVYEYYKDDIKLYISKFGPETLLFNNFR